MTLTAANPNSSTKLHPKPKLTLLLANPRGFCAGVVRAIDIVERALTKYGAPVYVRHEIVHNRFVVRGLETKGAVFVKEVADADPARPIIFSAHGVAKSVPADAQARNMHFIDATCPLVSKVHREAERDHSEGRHIILIGHAGHPEVIGTMGQLDPGAVTLVERVEDVAGLSLPDKALSYVTQTTLSVDDTAEIITALQARFPEIKSPNSQDICYATTNRQEAVKHIGEQCDLFLVVGAPNSSNSNRLVDVAKIAGASHSMLVQDASEIDWSLLSDDIATVGLSAGASAPEVLVEGIIDALGERFDLEVRPVTIREEHVRFNIPRELRDVA